MWEVENKIKKLKKNWVLVNKKNASCNSLRGRRQIHFWNGGHFSSHDLTQEYLLSGLTDLN